MIRNWNPTTLVLILVLLTGLANAEKRRLFILHTNDIHGHIEAYDKGGLSRIASAIKLFRSVFPGQVVLLDGGDTSLGTALSGASFGKPTAELMTHLKYDAITVGNHEFSWGKKKMRALTDGLGAPVLCANLVTQDGSPPPYPAFTMVERNGVKLAIVGLVAPDTYRRVHPEAVEGWEFLPAVQAVRSVLPTLPEDYDALISLNHIGVEEDEKLAQAVPELDLIVGAHSHTPLHQVLYQGKVPIVQAGVYAEYLGILEVLVDTETNTLQVVGYHLQQFDESSPEDPTAHEMVERYAVEMRPVLQEIVANVTEFISLKPVGPTYDTPLGNLISDILRSEAKTDIALYNRGGVRLDMQKGPLTVEAVHKLFPFDDPVVVLEASGAQVRQIMEQGTIDGEGPLSSSGLTATLEKNKVTTIEVDGKPLDLERTYTISTTYFLAGGGDGMATLTQLKKVRQLSYTRDVILSYLKTHKTLAPPETGRLREP
jgi:5'-nucleotidase / UDP-sugar diphosphatase